MSAPALLEVYFDFDNTITGFDVLDDLIQRFSINGDWKVAEAEWTAGRIGSRECLERQLANVRLTAPELDRYLRTVPVDPALRPLLDLLAAHGVPAVVVSDSFVPVITPILEHNGVTGLPVYANDLRLEGDRPVLGFPYFHSICSSSGNCKCSHLLKRNRRPGTRKVYVGDGRSDICPAAFCEILFAKDSLLRHYSPLRQDCLPFENLGTVHAHLQRLLT